MAGAVDATLAAQNMAIAAESLGLGTCYSGGIRDGIVQIAPLLNIPDDVFPVLGLVVGYPQKRNALKPRLPFESIYHENHYNPHTEKMIAEYDQETNQYYTDRLGQVTDRSWSKTATTSFKTHPRAFMKRFLNEHGLAKH